MSSHVSDFNTRNKLLTAKLLNQSYRYHKLRKAFSKFYRRHFDLVSKSNVGLKSLLQQGLSEPEFNGDLVYKFRKIYACDDFSTLFRKIILRYIKINVIRQTACMVVKKKEREKSREYLNHKPQPFPDTKRKRKPTKPNKHKSNKRTKSNKISSIVPKRGNRNAKRTEKHKNKITQGKT